MIELRMAARLLREKSGVRSQESGVRSQEYRNTGTQEYSIWNAWSRCEAANCSGIAKPRRSNRGTAELRNLNQVCRAPLRSLAANLYEICRLTPDDRAAPLQSAPLRIRISVTGK
jgi:hypothetical protein